MDTAAETTRRAIRRQVAGMGTDLFEIGLFKQDVTGQEPAMIPRVWDAHAIVRSIPWLRHQNLNGRNIFIRPKGESCMSLVDDLSAAAIDQMKHSGFAPAIVVQTSPGNFQAWLKHPELLDRETGTAVAQALATEFGGDTKAADWRHFGRLSGLTNRKTKHQDQATGLYPFVSLIEASGVVYPNAEEFLQRVREQILQRKEEQARILQRPLSRGSASEYKSIESFRVDPRYCADGTRIDLAYAVYALSRGASAAEVEATIRSRDLSHKGSELRQHDYITRTIRKALAAVQKGVER